MTIDETRTRAGNAAREFAGLALDEARGLDLTPASMRHFFETLRDQLNGILRDDKTDAPDVSMSDAEAKDFGARLMTFGKHQGDHVRDVPVSDLDWVNEDEWRAELRRYLASDYVKRQRGQLDE